MITIKANIEHLHSLLKGSGSCFSKDKASDILQQIKNYEKIGVKP